jgi:hypothetical protein
MHQNLGVSPSSAWAEYKDDHPSMNNPGRGKRASTVSESGHDDPSPECGGNYARTQGTVRRSKVCRVEQLDSGITLA